MPHKECDLLQILVGLNDGERAATPPYEEVPEWLSRAVQAGAIARPADKRYALSPEWVREMRTCNARHRDPYEAFEHFVDEFLNQDWPIVDVTPFVLPEEEYRQTVKALEERWKEILKRVRRRS